MSQARAKFPAAVLVLALIVTAAPLRADDLTFHEPSGRAAALGGAFMARSDDATGLFYNPAGLAFLGGLRIKTNILFGRRQTTAAWPDGGPAYRTDPSEFLGDAALAWQPVRGITVATGFFSPYNYESYWTPGWSADTAVTRNRLRTLYFRTAVAVEVVKGLAVSAGFDVVSSSLQWRHMIPFNLETYPQPQDINVESSHKLSGRGTSFVAGALWQVLPALRIGGRYQKAVTIEYSGTDIFNRMMDISGATVPDPHRPSRRVSDLIDFYYATQNVTGRLTLPEDIAIGAALAPVDWLTLYADVRRARWTGFGDWIFTSENQGDALNPAFTPEYQAFYGLALDYGVQGLPLALRDTTDIKTGLEVRPARYLALRAGYARLRSAVDEAGRTPVLPDLDRSVYSFGFGYEGPLFSVWGDGERVSDLSFDLFIRYAAASPGVSAFPGSEMTYGGSRLTFGFGAGLVF